ncbi:MAG TPA: hypothetical protein DIT94_01645 [Deltaproteobacteria bacterium]|nr:hypothetical protein [Deltaproteobacteria bacterium]
MMIPRMPSSPDPFFSNIPIRLLLNFSTSLHSRSHAFQQFFFWSLNPIHSQTGEMQGLNFIHHLSNPFQNH